MTHKWKQTGEQDMAGNEHYVQPLTTKHRTGLRR